MLYYMVLPRVLQIEKCTMKNETRIVSIVHMCIVL